MTKKRNPIKKLPSHLIDQIAAGEVVERPSSVVKELVENSLDARASYIEVLIKGGGLEEITVQDNGSGISFDELPLAVSRYATSKISSFEDLERISSFGFRGEALPSIGAVSWLEICSLVEGEDVGGRIIVDYGSVVSHTPWVMNKGTHVKVKNLFLNVPARLKFLKSRGYEGRRCEDVVCKLALVNLGVEFKLISEKKYLFFPKTTDLKERLKVLWGEDVVKDLVEVEGGDGECKVYGYVSKPSRVYHTSEKVLVYVNNRFVQSKIVLNAIRVGYKGRLLTKEYPFSVIFISLPLEDVDINVHPSKLEVRFKDEKRVFSGIQKAISKELDRKITYLNFYEKEFLKCEESSYKQVEGSLHVKAERKNLYKPEPFNKEIEPEITYICQLYETYILFVYENIVMVIDQHAAHERVLYNTYRNTNPGLINLNLPVKIDLMPDEADFFRGCSFFNKAGFEMFLEGERTLLIKKIPSTLSLNEVKEIVESTIKSRIDNLDEFWKFLACKKAVKAGDRLSKEGALRLIKMWLLTPDREFCPHGRPVGVVLSKKFFEELFKRK